MTMQELEELAELGLHHTMRWKSSVYPLCTLRDEKMNAEIYKNLAWASYYLSDWDGPVEEMSDRLCLILRDLSLQKNQTVDEGIVAQTISLAQEIWATAAAC